MDRGRFDALARLLATTRSRRSAVSTLIGAMVLNRGLDAAAKPGNGKSRKAGKSHGKDRDRGKKQQRQTRAEAVPASCFTGSPCTPGAGLNLAKCDYGNSATLENADVSGSNLKGANLANADASGANFRNSNLDGACLVEADLTGATLTGANTSGAIFCRTIMPDGSINNSGCNKATSCCLTCQEIGGACGGLLGGACCGGAACVGNVCTCPANRPNNCDGVCRGCCDDGDCGGSTPNCCNGTCRACCNGADCAPLGNNCNANNQCRCGTGPVCPSGSTCQAGECVIDVRPAQMNGWQFYNDQADLPIGPSFDAGPGSAPLGNGSAELKIGGSAEGELLSANILTGTRLNQLARLEYSYFVTSSTSATAPSLQLGIDFNLNDAFQGFQGRLVYVPSATGPAPTGAWVTVNTLDNSGTGNWFFSRQGAQPGGSGGLCPLSNPCTFSEVLGHFPNIGIHQIGPAGTGAGFGFIGFKVGSGEGAVDANVDALKIKLTGANQPTTVYNFDPNS